MPARAALAVLAAASALAVTACTQPADDAADDYQGVERDVAQAVDDLRDAGSRRDADEICATLLSDGLRRRVQEAARKPCPDALEDVLEDADSFSLDVTGIQVRGDRATVTVESDDGEQDRTDRLTLVRVRDTWRVDAFGG